jgi:hypothetical protein
MLLALALACADAHDDTSEEAPTVRFLAPLDGDVVTAGDVPVSILVEDFILKSPAVHNVGTGEGYAQMRVDGVDVLAAMRTNFTLDLAAGEHVLEAELFYTDGDALEPAVMARVTVTVE